MVMECDSFGLTQMAADDAQAQDLGARLHGQPHGHRFGGHNSLSEEHQQARVAAWDPAGAQVAVPVTLAPEDEVLVFGHGVMEGWIVMPRRAVFGLEALSRCYRAGIPPTRRAGDVRDRGARRPPRAVPGCACASDPRGEDVTHNRGRDPATTCSLITE
jgi:hypothetical protein